MTMFHPATGTLLGVAIFTTLALLGASGLAAQADYRFELTQTQAAGPGKTTLTIRLVHLPDNKPGRRRGAVRDQDRHDAKRHGGYGRQGESGAFRSTRPLSLPDRRPAWRESGSWFSARKYKARPARCAARSSTKRGSSMTRHLSRASPALAAYTGLALVALTVLALADPAHAEAPVAAAGRGATLDEGAEGRPRQTQPGAGGARTRHRSRAGAGDDRGRVARSDRARHLGRDRPHLRAARKQNDLQLRAGIPHSWGKAGICAAPKPAPWSSAAAPMRGRSKRS